MSTELGVHLIFFNMFRASRTGTRAEKNKTDFFLYFSLLQHALISLKNNVDRIQRIFDFFLLCFGPVARAQEGRYTFKTIFL